MLVKANELGGGGTNLTFSLGASAAGGDRGGEERTGGSGRLERKELRWGPGGVVLMVD